MRIFTAIAVPADIQDDLYERLDVLRDVRDDLRWAPPENYHVTTRFIGECGDREVDRQRDHWEQRCADVAPFSLSLQGAGCFPHDWMAKVLYAGVEGDLDSFRALAGPEQQPHVTIARMRELTDLTGTVLELSALSSRAWEVTEVIMFRSFIGRGKAPRYEEVDRFSLLGGCARPGANS